METYKTSDISLSAFLLTQGVTLKYIDRANEAKINFVFSLTPDLKTNCRQFWNHEARVCPLEYYLKLRFLKKIIFQNR